MDRKAAEQLIDNADSLVTCQNHQGFEIRATLVALRESRGHQGSVPSVIMREQLLQ